METLHFNGYPVVRAVLNKDWSSSLGQLDVICPKFVRTYGEDNGLSLFAGDDKHLATFTEDPSSTESPLTKLWLWLQEVEDLQAKRFKRSIHDNLVIKMERLTVREVDAYSAAKGHKLDKNESAYRFYVAEEGSKEKNPDFWHRSLVLNRKLHIKFS